MKTKTHKLRRKAAKVSLSVKMAGMSDNEMADAIRTASGGFLASQAWKDLRLLAIERYGLYSAYQQQSKEPDIFKTAE